MREEQTTGTLETLATTPMSSLELPVGVVSFPFLFATMAGVYLLIASVWMSLDTSHTSWSGLTLVLVAAEPRSRRSACSPAAAAIALKRGQMISAIAIYLMSILGDALPSLGPPRWLQPLANLMPVKYAFDGAGRAVLGADWETEALVLVPGPSSSGRRRSSPSTGRARSRSGRVLCPSTDQRRSSAGPCARHEPLLGAGRPSRTAASSRPPPTRSCCAHSAPTRM